MYCTRLKLFMLLEEKIPFYSLIDKVFQYIRINYWIFTFLVPRFPLSHSFTQHRAAERPFPLFTTYNTHNRENVHMYMILYNHETQLSIGQSPDIGVYCLHMLRSSATSAINKPAWSDIKYIYKTGSLWTVHVHLVSDFSEGRVKVLHLSGLKSILRI